MVIEFFCLSTNSIPTSSLQMTHPHTRTVSALFYIIFHNIRPEFTSQLFTLFRLSLVVGRTAVAGSFTVVVVGLAVVFVLLMSDGAVTASEETTVFFFFFTGTETV